MLGYNDNTAMHVHGNSFMDFDWAVTSVKPSIALQTYRSILKGTFCAMPFSRAN